MALEIILISSLSIISTIIGIWWARFCVCHQRLIAGAVGFAAGVMLYLSISELLIKPLRSNPWPTVLLWFVLGIIIIALLDWILPHVHHFYGTKKISSSLTKMAFLIAIGMILHDIPEGIAIAGTYSLDKSWGWLVGLGVAIHNIPEELVIALPLIITKQKKTLIILAIASALAEPFGALLGIGFGQISPAILLPMTVFTGGAMTYIAIHELIPFGLKIKPVSGFIIGLIIGLLAFGILASIL